MLERRKRLGNGERDGTILQDHQPAIVAVIVGKPAVLTAAGVEIGVGIVVGMDID
jgi:hypothetical protein